jgi:hypothetical protein
VSLKQSVNKEKVPEEASLKHQSQSERANLDADSVHSLKADTKVNTTVETPKQEANDTVHQDQ